MAPDRKFCTPSARALLRAAACIVSIMMLLTFPMPPGHDFKNHFRTPQVRRVIKRHTFVAQPEGRAADFVAPCAVQPTLLNPLDDESNIKPFPHFELPTQLPLTDLLQRLKVGFSRADSEDPLL